LAESESELGKTSSGNMTEN